MRYLKILSVWFCGFCGGQNRSGSGACVFCNRSRFIGGAR